MISVIMSIYNEPLEMIKQSVISILRQSERDFEYLIVNDYPEDVKRAKMIKEICESDSRIRLIENHKNIGLTKSLIKAIDEAKGEYICRMDADDIAVINRIEIQKKYLDKNRLGFVASPVKLLDQDGRIVGDTKYIANFSQKEIKFLLKHANVLHHPTFFMTKELYDRIGGYSADVKIAQDFDLIQKVIKMGNQIGITKEITLYYRIWNGNISHQKEALQRYNTVKIVSKYWHLSGIDEFKKFEKVYLKFKDDTSVAKRFWATAKGMLQVKSFRKYIVHTLILKCMIVIGRNRK